MGRLPKWRKRLLGVAATLVLALFALSVLDPSFAMAADVTPSPTPLPSPTEQIPWNRRMGMDGVWLGLALIALVMALSVLGGQYVKRQNAGSD